MRIQMWQYILNSRDMEGCNISAEWVNLIMNTEENRTKKIYCSLPVRKPNDRWIDVGPGVPENC